MSQLSDIEIAQQCKPRHITEIAKKAHIDEKYIEQYGNYKAKIDPQLLKETDRKKRQAHTCYRYNPHPRRRGQDNDNNRSGRRSRPSGQGCYGCAA